MRTLVLLFLVAGLLGAAVTPTISTVKLNDLPAVAAQQAAIKRIVAQGIIEPATATTFNPNGTVTRGDFAVMLQRLFALQAPAHVAAFTDINIRDPRWGSIQAVAIYMNPQVFCFGCALQSTFSPNAPISRGQATVYILRVLAAQGKVSALSPSAIDSTIASTAGAKTWDPRLAPLYALGVKEQIAPLYGSAGLAPNTAVTRVHAAVLLDNTQRLKAIPLRNIRSL